MMNLCVVEGHMTADPELRAVGQNENKVCQFRIGVPRRFRREGQPDTDFVSVVAWNKNAEFVAQYFGKGKAIGVVGTFQTKTWEKDGQKHSGFFILADQIHFVGSKEDSAASSASARKSAARPAPTAKKPQHQPIPYPTQDGMICDSEDLPF